MTVRKPYTPGDLRKLAKQRGPQWDGEVRDALSFCADMIQAADTMRDSHEAAIKAEVAKEREACAILSWSIGMAAYGPHKHARQYDSREMCSAVAAAIRARGAAHD